MFKKFSAFVAVLFLFGGGAFLDAQEPQVAVINVEAAISLTSEGVIVEYHLSAPVTEFRFDHSVEGDGEEQAIPLRRDNWKITNDGFTFNGLTLERSDGGSFDRFSLFAKPDARDYDRVYTGVFRMDQKVYGFYSRHFIGDTEKFETAFCVVHDEICSTDMFDAAGPQVVTEGSFLLLGNFPVQKIGSISVMVSPLLPSAVAQEMLQTLIENIATYEKTFGFSAPEKASVFLSYDPGGNGYRGGVAAGASVYMQLRGSIATLEPETLNSIKEFVTHEVVHFWNGELFDSTDNASQSWLHEGGATYFAAAATWPEETLYKKVSNWLNNCQRSQSPMPLDGSGGQVAGQAPYQCGAFIHWLLDKGLLHGSDNRVGIGQVWKTMFQRVAKNGDNLYSAKMFEETVRNLSGDAIWQTVKPILAETGKKRFAGVVDVLTKYGYGRETKKAEDFSAYDLLGPVFYGFLNTECEGGAFNFYFNGDHLKFENDQRCGAMSGEFTVRTLDGFNLFSEAALAFRRVVEACTKKESVVFADPVSGKQLSVACKMAPPVLPTHYNLVPLSN